MRKLTVNEIEEVGGGFFKELLLAIAGAYIYDKVGGAEGIEAGVMNLVDSAPPISAAHIQGSK